MDERSGKFPINTKVASNKQANDPFTGDELPF
jgi:hypothetical protein